MGYPAAMTIVRELLDIAAEYVEAGRTEEIARQVGEDITIDRDEIAARFAAKLDEHLTAQA